MNKQILFSLLVVAISITFIQSCELERIDPSCPVITSLTPGAAKYDETVSVTGSGFESGKPGLYKINIGDIVVPDDNILGVPNTTTIRFKVPKGIGSGPLKVSLKGGPVCTGQSLNFIYKYTVKPGDIMNPFAGVTNQISCPKCFSSPQGLEVDANSNIIVADMDHHVIKKIDTSLRDPIIFAGINDTYGHNDNSQLSSTFKSPSDVAISASGDVYVADKGNFCIRKISGGNVRVFSGNPLALPASDNGQPLSARYIDPTRIATNGTDLFVVTEPSMKRIRLINIITEAVRLPVAPP